MRELEKHGIWKVANCENICSVWPWFSFSLLFFSLKTKFCLQYLIISGEMSHML